MLEIHIPAHEYWDARKEEFFTTKETTLRLEHSLISLTKWEQKYKRPYLGLHKGPNTTEESLYYIRCMCIDKNVGSQLDPAFFSGGAVVRKRRVYGRIASGGLVPGRRRYRRPRLYGAAQVPQIL